jgi:hypothetical protein
MELLSKVKLQTLLASIRLEWKWLTVANTQAYFDMVLITTVKRFIVKSLVACDIKLFTKRLEGLLLSVTFT